MNNPEYDFMDKAKGLAKNPLGIIALFISMIYFFACSVLSISINNLQGAIERLPLIGFVIFFPFCILLIFTYLVIRHHEKLYGPSDYKDEKNFISIIGNKGVSVELENLIKSLKSESSDKSNGLIISRIIEKIEKIKEISVEIPINNLWKINHWGSSCARIIDDKMIFEGTESSLKGISESKREDGAHININDFLEIGKTYEISCFAKSTNNTTGMFRLWCHDKTGSEPISRINMSTDFKLPSTSGEIFKLKFEAKYNKNVRIHLQYKPGEGKIEVNDVRIAELKS